MSLKNVILSENVEARFQKMLGDNANQFLTSVLNTVNNNKLLQNSDPNTILTAAATAASLNLPIDNNLGYSWIVPYKGQAQFQIGWKGFVQLALRTNQYERINVVEVYENQFEFYNSLTEDLKADFSKPGEGDVIGYAGYFRLVNGFEKTVFWSKKQVTDHGKRFSKTFSNGAWKTDFNSMAKKTVVKMMLSKWGITSLELQKAVKFDQSVVDNDGTGRYVDRAPDIEEIENKEEVQRALDFVNKAETLGDLEMIQEGFTDAPPEVSEAINEKKETLKKSEK